MSKIMVIIFLALKPRISCFQGNNRSPAATRHTQSTSELPQLPTLCCPWHSGHYDLSAFVPVTHCVSCHLENLNIKFLLGDK